MNTNQYTKLVFRIRELEAENDKLKTDYDKLKASYEKLLTCMANQRDNHFGR